MGCLIGGFVCFVQCRLRLLCEADDSGLAHDVVVMSRGGLDVDATTRKPPPTQVGFKCVSRMARGQRPGRAERE